MATKIIGRIQPVFKGAYNADLSYEKLDRVEFSGSIHECAVNAEPGESPDVAPHKWTVIGSQISKAEFDGVKEKAEAALPQTGGDINGILQLVANYPRLRLKSTVFEKGSTPAALTYNSIQFVDKNDVLTGVIEQSWNSTGQIGTQFGVETLDANSVFRRSMIGIYNLPDGTSFGNCSAHPRANNYSTDIVTTKYLKDYAAEKTNGTVNIYVNANSTSASDTANLNAGRGLTVDMPFKTPAAAFNWANYHYTAGKVAIVLLSNVEWSGALR